MVSAEPKVEGRPADRRHPTLQRLSRIQNIGPFLALVLLVVVLSIVSEPFLSVRNIFNIVSQSSVQLIMALGMTVIIISGGIDLSVGSVLALTGSAMALMATHLGLSPFIAVVLGIGLGVGIGMLNGFVISRTGIPDFIMTLGMLSAARGVALIITRGLPVTGLPSGLTVFGAVRLFGVIPVAGVVAVVMAVIVWFILNYTQLGRCAYAIGGNREAARGAGYRF